MSIVQWPKEQRPREKLISQGAQVLSDAELIAVFLRVGVKGKSAVELGHQILQKYGSLQALLSTTLESFSSIHGLGPAKFAQLQAVLELARRMLSEDLKKGLTLASTTKVKDYLRLLIGQKAHESFTVLFLDVRLRLLDCEELFHGSLTNARIYPRELIKRALHHNAASVILAHNHPSGHITPSQADIEITGELQKALALVEIRVLDHLIVGENHCFSFSDHGLL